MRSKVTMKTYKEMNESDIKVIAIEDILYHLTNDRNISNILVPAANVYVSSTTNTTDKNAKAKTSKTLGKSKEKKSISFYE